jgi:tRNA-specific 2-thiouridylase
MVESYQAGETPNPDVMCNTFIKFGVFKEWAFKNGAERIATGHYARVMHNSLRNRYELHQGIDVGKDQSYFLHRLSSQDLSRILFPIGGFTKTEVRARARVCGLPVAHKPDSQGLCFVGDVSMHDFLSRFISVMSGDVIDMRGNVIGQHEGAALYTLGQRHGFTLAPSLAARGPLYIVGTDILENTIRVSENKEDAARLNVRVKDVHWIRGDAPSQAVAQVRYHGVFTNAQIQSNAQGYTIRFQSPQIVAPGQSIVFYEGDECLGGAIATHD